jgi:hypothetical protein
MSRIARCSRGWKTRDTVGRAQGYQRDNRMKLLIAEEFVVAYELLFTLVDVDFEDLRFVCWDGRSCSG